MFNFEEKDVKFWLCILRDITDIWTPYWHSKSCMSIDICSQEKTKLYLDILSVNGCQYVSITLFCQDIQIVIGYTVVSSTTDTWPLWNLIYFKCLEISIESLDILDILSVWEVQRRRTKGNNVHLMKSCEIYECRIDIQVCHSLTPSRHLRYLRYL